MNFFYFVMLHTHDENFVVFLLLVFCIRSLGRRLSFSGFFFRFIGCDLLHIWDVLFVEQSSSVLSLPPISTDFQLRLSRNEISTLRQMTTKNSKWRQKLRQKKNNIVVESKKNFCVFSPSSCSCSCYSFSLESCGRQRANRMFRLVPIICYLCLSCSMHVIFTTNSLENIIYWVTVSHKFNLISLILFRPFWYFPCFVIHQKYPLIGISANTFGVTCLCRCFTILFLFFNLHCVESFVFLPFATSFFTRTRISIVFRLVDLFLSTMKKY